LNKDTLYITFDGLSDPLGQSQILPYLCGIAKNGYNITILSCEKKERLEKEKARILELMAQFSISWQYIIYDEAGNFLSRFSYIRKLNAMAGKIRLEKNIRLIHCRSYLASLVGLKFKVKHRIPFIFDMRGFWADERIDGGIWKKDNALHRLFYTYFKRKEKQFLSNASAIVSLTNAAVVELSKTHSPYLTDKVTVIPCCTNTTLFSAGSVNGKIVIPGVRDSDHLIIYTGSIGTWYFTKEMIDCITEWRKQLPNIKLLVLTKDIKELNGILENYPADVRSLVVSASASYSQVPAYLAMAKAAMFFIKPSYSKIASSPTKMAECWAMNLPIITNAGIGDNDLYFNQHHGGILIHDFKATEYAAACEKYLALLQKKVNYRAIALDHFDTNMAIEKYTSIYHSLSA
jgi:hypothetical protein